MARRPLGHASRVDKDQRRPVLLRQLRELPVDLLPHVVGHHRLERRRRDGDRKIALAHVAGVDDRAVACGTVRVHAREETCDVLDRLLRRGQPDTHRWRFGQRREAFQRQGEVTSSLVRRQRVDLVDDHRAGRRQHAAAGFRAEQHIQRLRRRNDNVRRPLAHARAFVLRRITRTHQRPDLDIGKALRRKLAADARKRCREILLDVVRQRLQRRHVHDERLVGEAVGRAFTHEPIDRGEEGCERLAGSGRGCDQHVPAFPDVRPGARLRLGRRIEMIAEPGFNRRVEERGLLHGQRVSGREQPTGQRLFHMRAKRALASQTAASLVGAAVRCLSTSAA